METVHRGYVAAGRLLLGVGWLLVAVPTVFLVVYFPAGFLFLLMGGSLVAMPLYAGGILGIRLARFVRRGRYQGVTVVFAILQAIALGALAFHANTWDARTPGEAAFAWAVSFVSVLAAAASAGAAVLAVWAGREVRKEAPGDEQGRLWPWLVTAGAILLASLIGWTVPGRG